MAEITGIARIRTERTNDNILWAWVLGLILLALVVWGLSVTLHRDVIHAEGGTAEVRTLQAPQPAFHGPVA